MLVRVECGIWRRAANLLENVFDKILFKRNINIESSDKLTGPIQTTTIYPPLTRFKQKRTVKGLGYSTCHAETLLAPGSPPRHEKRVTSIVANSARVSEQMS